MNKSQMDAADGATLRSANHYTDEVSARTLRSANSYTDRQIQLLDDRFNDLTKDVQNRLSMQDKRMNRLGAMSSAMMSMSINAAGGRTENGRVAIGAGFQSGESAVSVGYAKSFGRASFSLGGSFSGDDKSAGIGLGIDL
ncbi:hypothetical protein A9J40_03330 [Stenotrophomonas maltophilia]|nr:hypothetical protein A9K70_07000 [Stenotrophomonas maltophilia]OBU69421.1 hypothetical protein A9J40_03330 [Stenotrophomonas maltophilia]